MLIVLPMHPFIMFPALFLISNASMHLRSSSLFMLQCRILQVMDGMSRGGANPLLMGGCEGSFCRLFGNFAESLAYSKSTFKCVLLYPLLSRFSTSEFFRANRNVMRNRPVEKELRDLFPLSTSILIRLADVISDTDKGKRSFRARKFASGKPTLSPLLLNSNKRYLLKLLHAISYREP